MIPQLFAFTKKEIIMGVPMLGGEPISIEEANEIYDSAQLLFKRYDPSASLDQSEVGPQMTVDEHTFAIRSSDAVISVVRGNVFARDSVIRDVTRIGALQGRMGRVIADLEKTSKSSKQALKRLEGRLLNKYTRMLHSKEGIPGYEDVPRAKMLKDNLMALAINDDEHKEYFETLIAFELNYDRAYEARNGLSKLDNDLKKALEHGEKAQ